MWQYKPSGLGYNLIFKTVFVILISNLNNRELCNRTRNCWRWLFPNPCTARKEIWTQHVQIYLESSSRPRQGSPLSLHDRAEDKVKKYKEEEPLALGGHSVRWWRKHQLFSLLRSFLAWNVLWNQVQLQQHRSRGNLLCREGLTKRTY